MEIRKAAESDSEAVAELFRSDPAFICSMTEAILVRKVIGTSLNSVVAVEAGRIAGFLSVEKFEYHPAAVEFRNLFVAPSHRGSTVASHVSTRLYLALEPEVPKQYETALVFDVCGHRYSQVLAQRSGYSPVAFIPRFYGSPDITQKGQPESFLVMAKKLNRASAPSIESLVEKIGCLTYDGPIRHPSEPEPIRIIELSNPEYIAYASLLFSQGYVPNGVLPISGSLLIMGFVSGPFDESKISVISKAKPLVERVGAFYRQAFNSAKNPSAFQ